MFDPYYETKVNPRWGKLPIGSVLGGLLIFLGLLSMVWSIVDLSEGVTPTTGSSWQENSMWPTIGKGIWVGALMIATGIVGIISQRERTQVSLYVFNALCWITALFSLFQLLSSILHIEPYMQSTNLNSNDKRSKRQNLEIAMNALLIATGGLGFLTALSAGILSCLAGNCCVNRRRAVTSLLALNGGASQQPYQPLPTQYQQQAPRPPTLFYQQPPQVFYPQAGPLPMKPRPF